MQRSTFKVLFYVKRQSEKSGQVPVMGRITINGTMSQFSCKLTVRSTLWDAKANKAAGKSLRSRSASTRSWRTSRPISANSTSVSATGIRMLRPKRSATPSSVWATTAACCYRPSTNTLQGSSNVWARNRAYSSYEDYCQTPQAACRFPRIRIPRQGHSFQRVEAGFYRKVRRLPLLGTRACVPERSSVDGQEIEV